MNVLKLLFNPIFLLAAGLHAGLLLIPVAGGSSDAVVPAPDPEGESITVTRIPPKAAQPPKTAAKGTPTPTARPTTTAGVAAVQQRPATAGQTTTTTAQQGTAPTRRTQSRQPSSSSSNSNTSNSSSSTNRRRATGNTGGSNRNRNNRSNQTANQNSNNEIAVLPSNNNQAANNSSPNTSRNSNTGQTSPTLVVLKQGAQSREVPNLLQEILARLQHSVRHTTEPEMEEIKGAWLTTLTEQTGLEISDANELEEALEISYPFIDSEDGRRFLSCLSPVPKKGVIGVMVNADGMLSTEPTLLRSSGYAFINDIALEKIQDYTDFPEANMPTVYTVNIDVNYDKDTCVDLAKLTKS